MKVVKMAEANKVVGPSPEYSVLTTANDDNDVCLFVVTGTSTS